MGPALPAATSRCRAPRASDFQFADDKASFGALAQWLDVFGGTIAAKDIRREDGTPARLCRVRFTYHGVPAEAYAVVTAEPATT